MNLPRWATENDNKALLELTRACPMSGAVPLYFDRSPDYFTLSRLQGAGGKVCVIDGKDGGIAAVATAALFPQIFFQGKIRQAMYACDLKIHPQARSGYFLKRIYHHLYRWSVDDCGCNMGFTTIMQANQAMKSIIAGKANIKPSYQYAGTVRNYTVHYLFSKKSSKEIEIRRANLDDLSEMIAFWNRIQINKDFTPYWSIESFSEFLKKAPGLEIHHYYLAFKKDKLVGLLATWDQRSFKQMIVLDYNSEMRRMKLWYNPLASLLKLAKLPQLGNAMPYFYVVQLAAETPEILQALYTTVYNDNNNGKYLFFSTMLDVRDPLNCALDNFITKHVDIELYILDQSLQNNNSLIYFDPSIV